MNSEYINSWYSNYHAIFTNTSDDEHMVMKKMKTIWERGDTRNNLANGQKFEKSKKKCPSLTRKSKKERLQ